MISIDFFLSKLYTNYYKINIIYYDIYKNPGFKII